MWKNANSQKLDPISNGRRSSSFEANELIFENLAAYFVYLRHAKFGRMKSNPTKVIQKTNVNY